MVEGEEFFGWAELGPGRAFVGRLPDSVVGETHEDSVRAFEVGKLSNLGFEVKSLMYNPIGRFRPITWFFNLPVESYASLTCVPRHFAEPG